MEENWYCFLLDGLNMRGKDDIEVFLYRKMEEIFGDDLIDIKIIGERITDTSFELFSESYFFVCCRNYKRYIEKIKDCSVISLVLPSVSNPEIVELSSIEEFATSINKACGNNLKLSIGDVVTIKGGHYENLYGIVVECKHKDMYDIYFRLYTRQIIEHLYRNNLVFVESIFKSLNPDSCDCNYMDNPLLSLSSTEDNILCGLCKKNMIELYKTKNDDLMKDNLCENKVRRKLHRTRKKRH